MKGDWGLWALRLELKLMRVERTHSQPWERKHPGAVPEAYLLRFR